MNKMPLKCPKNKKEVYFFTKAGVRIGGCGQTDSETGKLVNFVVKEAKKFGPKKKS